MGGSDLVCGIGWMVVETDFDGLVEDDIVLSGSTI
jgi:hypothetical protein